MEREINYTTIPRSDGKNCGNCAESDCGWCFYAGEIGNHYCDKWSEGGCTRVGTIITCDNI